MRENRVNCIDHELLWRILFIMNYILRSIQSEMKILAERERGRLVVLTGARQTGKSTLAGALHPDWQAVSLDSPLERTVYLKYTPAQWQGQYPRLILDEVQKAPELFETVKACYDRFEEMRILLLGSSQVLLMKGVRESLAGRAVIRELFPLTLAERLGAGDKPSLLQLLLSKPQEISERLRTLNPDITLKSEYADATEQWRAGLVWGGMPAIQHPGWSEQDRREWLHDYCLTYLQRDLGDLAQLERLEPFVRAQKVAAHRTSACVNYADMARAADVSPVLMKQFLRYLEISYQVVLLPAWTRNPEKRLSKMPKLHFVDSGIRRALLGKQGDPDGAEFESHVFSEVFKCLKNQRLPWEYSHLRTADGREVDLLLEHETGVIALECKQTPRVSSVDFRHLRDLESIVSKPILCKILVSMDPRPQLDLNGSCPIWAIPAPLLFQPEL